MGGHVTIGIAGMVIGRVVHPLVLPITCRVNVAPGLMRTAVRISRQSGGSSPAEDDGRRESNLGLCQHFCFSLVGVIPLALEVGGRRADAIKFQFRKPNSI